MRDIIYLWWEVNNVIKAYVNRERDHIEVAVWTLLRYACQIRKHLRSLHNARWEPKSWFAKIARNIIYLYNFYFLFVWCLSFFYVHVCSTVCGNFISCAVVCMNCDQIIYFYVWCSWEQRLFTATSWPCIVPGSLQIGASQTVYTPNNTHTWCCALSESVLTFAAQKPLFFVLAFKAKLH